MKKNTSLETMTALAFFLFLGVLSYYAFYPFRITTLHSMGIDKPEYCRGEWVRVEMDFEKHMDIQADIKWYIVDGIVYQLDSPGISRPEGQNKVTVSKQVPHSVLPGEYNLRIEMEYNVHPLRSPIITSWDTPKFTVLDESDCPKKDELELGEPDPNAPKPTPDPSPTPMLLPVLYPVHAEGNSQIQEQNIVVPDRSTDPQGEPQTPVPPQTEKPSLLDRIKKIIE